MAMTKCKECGKEVSDKAKVCPHCGVKNPGVKASDMFIGAVTLVAIIWGAIWFFSDDDDAVAEETAPARTEEEIAAFKAEKAAELATCKKDIQCWGDKNNVEAGIQCDEYVERLANYSFEWTDGWMEPKFSHFRWLNMDKGYVTYIGDKIKFQNGFGAWQQYTYECDFDPETNLVMDVRAAPGRI